MIPRVRVGTCSFADRQAPTFRDLDLVEIQQTFCQPPRIATAERWRRTAPSAFAFTLKAWQLITPPPLEPDLPAPARAARSGRARPRGRFPLERDHARRRGTLARDRRGACRRSYRLSDAGEFHAERAEPRSPAPLLRANRERWALYGARAARAGPGPHSAPAARPFTRPRTGGRSLHHDTARPGARATSASMAGPPIITSTAIGATSSMCPPRTRRAIPRAVGSSSDAAMAEDARASSRGWTRTRDERPRASAKRFSSCAERPRGPLSASTRCPWCGHVFRARPRRPAA